MLHERLFLEGEEEGGRGEGEGVHAAGEGGEEKRLARAEVQVERGFL